MSRSGFYVTTPIYYVNDVPHLGHAYTTIVADALARYHRALGESVWFLTGTDEHGQKIEEAAEKKRLKPIQLADQVVARFRETWSALHVSHDDFIRTTEERHERVVLELWRRMHERGDLCLGEYEDWYCVGCEAFYTEGQLVDGRCPTHERPVTRLKEASYFFALSRYQEPLLRHYEEHPEFILPENRRNEVVSFVRSGLRDLSVSRTTFRWGIPVPGDPAHVIYVWIDALANYVSALGGPGGDLYKKHWPASVHLIGKDILRFHAVYWPAMLMSAGLPLPERIFAHGWWNVSGKKISKSLPATRVSPTAIAEEVSADALRYFVLREVPLGQDGDFSYEALIARINADLANDLGNLVNRTLAMVAEYVGGVVPEPREDAKALEGVAADAAARAARAWADLAPHRALEAAFELVRAANKHIVENEPWVLHKDPARRDRLGSVLYHVLEAIRWIAEMVEPAMPTAARRLREALGIGADVAPRWPSTWGTLAAGLETVRIPPLFPRIDRDREQALLAKWLPPDAAENKGAAAPPAGASAAGAPAGGPVTIEEFRRLDLRVAAIVAAEPVAGADRLLKIVVDLGGEKREVVAGIASRYRPADLVGKKVVFCANLKPTRIRGVRSEGMILAAGEPDVLALTALDADVAPGTKIR
jgi:methionyl-tRNA synthetase